MSPRSYFRSVSPECPNRGKVPDHVQDSRLVRFYTRLESGGSRQFVAKGWYCGFCDQAWTDSELTEPAEPYYPLK